MEAKTITRLDYEQRIGRVLRHLQANPSAHADLQALAKLAHFSPFHFHRVFTGMVGETVAAYQRRLRLERAADLLAVQEDQVLRVALDSGFESHEAFSRAFKSHFGCTPSEYRNLEAEARRTILTRPRPAQAGPATIQVEVRRMETMRVASISRVGPYEQAGEAFGAIFAWATARGAWDFKSPAIGVYHDDPGATPPERLRFEACLPVKEGAQGDEQVQLRTIPGGDFAVAVHKGPYWRLAETYQMLYSRWLPDSGREPADRPCIERYLNNPRQVPEHGLLTEVCAPLE